MIKTEKQNESAVCMCVCSYSMRTWQQESESGRQRLKAARAILREKDGRGKSGNKRVSLEDA